MQKLLKHLYTGGIIISGIEGSHSHSRCNLHVSGKDIIITSSSGASSPLSPVDFLHQLQGNPWSIVLNDGRYEVQQYDSESKTKYLTHKKGVWFHDDGGRTNKPVKIFRFVDLDPRDVEGMTEL